MGYNIVVVAAAIMAQAAAPAPKAQEKGAAAGSVQTELEERVGCCRTAAMPRRKKPSRRSSPTRRKSRNRSRLRRRSRRSWTGRMPGQPGRL